MADGALNLTLDEYASAKLAEKAKAVGLSPEILAAQMLAESLAEDSFDALQHDHASNYDLSEEGRPWSDVRPELVARMGRKLAQPK